MMSVPGGARARCGFWMKRILVGLVALTAVAYVLVTMVLAPYWLGGIATTRRFQFPDKENAGLTPKSFELAFEDVVVPVHRRRPLKGWWVPAEQAKGTRRAGPRPEPLAHRNGAAGRPSSTRGLERVLLDLRHHGESGGEATTLGVKEKEDVKAAVALGARAVARARWWCGACRSGGARSTLAAADDPGIAGARVRQQLPQPARHRPHHLAMAAASAGGCGSFPRWPGADLGALLDRPPRRLRPERGRRGGGREEAQGPARRCSCATRRTGACPRRSRSR